MRILSALLLTLMPVCASASPDRVQARVFAGRLFSQPTDFNTLISSQGMNDFGTIDKTGVEGAYNLFDAFDLGLRLSHNSADNISKTTSSNYAVVRQDNLQVVAHVPVFKRHFFRLDLVGAYGVSTTDIAFEGSTQKGHASHSGLSEGFTEGTVSNYGASVSIGWSGKYLFIEAGQESNQVSSLTRTGTVSSSINSIDLSGAYWIAGIHIDGTFGKAASTTTAK